jgi:hypothetical protein
MVIEYIGGFKQFPSALERAMWEALQTIWANSDHTTGVPVAGSGGSSVVQGGGEVNRISIADFGAINFNYGATVVGGNAASTSAAQQAHWGWLAPWANIFEIYRSEAAPGTAFA